MIHAVHIHREQSSVISMTWRLKLNTFIATCVTSKGIYVRLEELPMKSNYKKSKLRMSEVTALI